MIDSGRRSDLFSVADNLFPAAIIGFLSQLLWRRELPVFRPGNHE